MKKFFLMICLILVFAIFVFIGSTYASNSIYNVVIDDDNMIIKNINVGTSGIQLINILNLNKDDIEFYRGGSIISNTDKLYTGDILKNTNSNNEYKLSVLGDVLGEGIISYNGIKKIAKHIINGNILKDEFLIAADYNNNGVVKMNDAIFLFRKMNATDDSLVNPVKINYEKDESGKFVFINNPEGIRTDFLADSDYGNRLIYKDTFSGNMELYYEHSTYEGRGVDVWDGFYYAIKFYNPNSSDVTLTVNRAGSTINNWPLTWEKYYSEGNNMPSKTYTIKPREVLYFFHSDNNSYSFVDNINEAYSFNGYIGFDGVLNVTASNKLHFATLAFKNLNNTSNATYPGSVENVNDKPNLRVITGSVNMLPELYNNSTFVIDDSVEADSNLKIICTNGRIYDHWNTNYVGAWSNSSAGLVYPANEDVKCVYKDDILPLSFTSELGSKVTVRPFYSGVDESYDSRSTVIEAFGARLQFGASNWAVHYHENITLINAGNNSRIVSFIMKPAIGSTYSIVQDTINASKNINYLDNSNKFLTSAQQNPENIMIWKVKIEPGQTITVPAIVTLGGMSNGDISKFIRIDS